ncbi:FIMAH domain-containing protein [Paenibacillus eucommiae]|uniref:Beta-galactosidase n=1 Tax=Paenibacillus eucommiae TaxID=1355755 RepID=A0ABS4IPH3_9BACL|nr:carbohydrate binding domain-containing protein [Paenibacillus eucommiae]MBP1989460.1 hypothetical protein [Paenibacillus eucommiae]
MMKWKFARKTVCFSLAVLMLVVSSLMGSTKPAAADEVNLLVNPGFESGTLDPWSRESSVSITNLSANVRTGNYAAELTEKTTQVNQYVGGLSPNTTYQLTGYAKMDSGAIFIGVRDYGGDILTTTLTGNSYSKGTVTFKTGPTNTSLRVFCYRPSGETGSAYCDDFSLTAVPVVPNTFPIGLFWPPGPADTTQARYEEMREMNANFFIGNNSVTQPHLNDAALNLAAANDFKIIVNDDRFAFDDYKLSQAAAGGTLSVSNTQSLGQTFTFPVSGNGWYLWDVKLDFDQAPWPVGTTATLSVYDSPAKQTLYKSTTISSPEHIFNLRLIPVTGQTSYYMELTSNSTDPISLSASTNDSYPEGQAYVNGTAQNVDAAFDIIYAQLVYSDGARNRPSDTNLDGIAGDYKNYEATKGYYLLDEPDIFKMAKLQEAARRLKMNDPNHMVFVNLYPNYASDEQLGLDVYTTGQLTSTQPLGQTIQTEQDQTHISTVQVWLDHQTWGAGETVTLKLWDSPAKGNLIASAQRTESATDWPQFHLNANVQADTTYYMELALSGTGSSIDGVVRSNTGHNWVNDGTAYAAGTPIDADLWFTIDQDIQGGTYEDYVYRWASKKPDVLSFDHYPFSRWGGMSEDYFANLEVIRRQALLAGIDFWSYIQSVQSTGLRMPTESEMRFQIYTNLAYGAKGYMFYTYFQPEGHTNAIILGDGTRNTSYYWAKNINAEVQFLGTTLKSLTSEAVYQTGTLPDSTTAVPDDFFWQPADSSKPATIGYFSNQAGRKYVMVVNRDSEHAQTLSFDLSPKPASVKEVSKTTGQEVDTNYNPATGALSASFAPGEGRLYALDASFGGATAIANDIGLTAQTGVVYSGVLSANYTGDYPLTYSIVTNGNKGTAAITNAATGAFTYTPHAGASGNDKFTFRVYDGIHYSNTADAAVTIESVSVPYKLSDMSDIIGEYRASGDINQTFAAQLNYRLMIIQILLDQESKQQAVAYMEDFLSYINDAAVQAQQLISGTATEKLNTIASQLIETWKQ